MEDIKRFLASPLASPRHSRQRFGWAYLAEPLRPRAPWTSPQKQFRSRIAQGLPSEFPQHEMNCRSCAYRARGSRKGRKDLTRGPAPLKRLKPWRKSITGPLGLDQSAVRTWATSPTRAHSVQGKTCSPAMAPVTRTYATDMATPGRPMVRKTSKLLPPHMKNGR